jgi:transcriptional regulator with XRE-family HTH domain
MLKVFQLRVARSTLGLGVRDIGVYIGLSRSTISNLERDSSFLDLNITDEQNTVLLKIFNDKGIYFSNANSVYHKKINLSLKTSLTRFQLRGARSILGLSQRELSEHLEMKKSDLNYLENLDNTSRIAIKKIDISANSIELFFNSKNISFPNDGTIEVDSLPPEGGSSSLRLEAD